MATNDDAPSATDRQMIYVNSGYGATTRLPFVSLKLRDVAVTISPDEARDVASNLLRGAESAEGDAFVIEFFMDKFDLTLAQAAALIVEFREWRDERRRDGS